MASSAISIPIRTSTTWCSSWPRLHGASADGLTVWRERACRRCTVRKNTIARVPPMPTVKGSVMSNLAGIGQGALHHRTSLASSARGRPRWFATCWRTPIGRRLAVIVNEFGDVGIDGEDLKSNGAASRTASKDAISRARQRLHLLHRRRRLRAGAEEPARPAEPARAHRDRDQRPGPAQATGDGVQLARDRLARDGRRRGDGGRWRRRCRRPLRRRSRGDRAASSAPTTTLLDHDNPLEEVFEDQLLCADLVILNKADLMAGAEAQRTSRRRSARYACLRVGQGGRGAERPGADQPYCSASAPGPKPISAGAGCRIARARRRARPRRLRHLHRRAARHFDLAAGRD